MNTAINTKFRVSQIIGSLRMEGIAVSSHDEKLMTDIVDGKVDVAEQRRRLVAEYKKKNMITLKDDMGIEDDYIDPVAMSGAQLNVVETTDYIVLYVTAGRVPFDGERLLKEVYGYGMLFGEMGMFHRHELPNGHGQVLFSMAQADDVGAFDLETMSSKYFSALTFFLALPNQQPYLAYDMMVDTAMRLAHVFSGQVLDQNQKPLTRQLIDDYREQVVEFTRLHLMRMAV